MGIKMNTYAGGQITAGNDAILHDRAIANTGILHGCNITFMGANQIHIEKGYLLIKGRYCTVTEDTIQVAMSNSETELPGRLYVRADLADAQEPVKILSVAAEQLPELTQDENFNYDNGVWEMELATYTAGMTAIKDLTVTCEEVPEGASKKETAALLGKMDELTENLTSVIGFPDYSNSEMLITNKKGSGTIAENGWLAIIESGAASEMTVKINNKISYTVRLANSLTIPVTTGDTWEVTYFTANCYLWFIPNKVF